MTNVLASRSPWAMPPASVPRSRSSRWPTRGPREWCIPLVIGDARVLERAMEATGTRLAGPAHRCRRRSQRHAGNDRRPRRRRDRHGRASLGRDRPALRRGRRALDQGGRPAGARPARSTPWCRRRSTRRRCTRPAIAYEGQTEILGELTAQQAGDGHGRRPHAPHAVHEPHGAARGVRVPAHRPRARSARARRRGAARHGDRAAAHRGRRPEPARRRERRVRARGARRDRARRSRRRARAGIDAQGPFPADTVFLKSRDGAYDMTLALYHDQGLMAVKLVGFGRVVTLLIGLPLIRTSTGHGTAFDIAGKNIADHVNLLEAVRVAAEVARGKQGSPRARPGGGVRDGRRERRRASSTSRCRTGPGSTSIPAIRRRASSRRRRSRTATSATCRCSPWAATPGPTSTRRTTSSTAAPRLGDVALDRMVGEAVVVDLRGRAAVDAAALADAAVRARRHPALPHRQLVALGGRRRSSATSST